MELYKKHRPKTMAAVVGNSATVKSISKKIEDNTLPHFITLTGPSGCGKTTIARIMATSLGVDKNDLVEVNCANKNGVDLARDIESKVEYKPLGGGSRLWIMDEAHQMTKACSNSLLKVLEDTPSHAYFVFCTSEPKKMLEALKTRATEYKVTTLNEAQSEKLLKKVCKREKIELSEKVIASVIDSSQGSARKLLVYLDQIKDLESEADQIEATKVDLDAEGAAFDLLKEMLWGQGNLKKCMGIIKTMQDDPEGVRRMIMTTCGNQLVDASKARLHEKAYDIMVSFEKPFFDMPRQQLIMATYDYCTGE